MYQDTQKMLENDIICETVPNIPNMTQDFVQAQMILKQCSVGSGDCLYDHLAKIIENVLCDRPENVMDYFEEYSRNLRESKYHHEEHFFQETYIQSHSLQKARQVIHDFQILQELKLNQDNEEFDKDLLNKVSQPNLLSFKPVLDIIGVGISQQDAFFLTLSHENFLRDTNVVSCRFWGKIFGLQKNYWIFEVQVSDVAVEAPQAKQSSITPVDLNIPPTPSTTDAVVSTPEDTETPKVPSTRPAIPDLPKSTYIQTPDTPQEPLGKGVNRFLYYASNKPFSDTWHELPLVTPKHILVARQIKKVFTGNLTNEVISYPKFEGTEAHLLRAMIARITATAFVAPIDYWVKKKPKDDGDEEEAEEEQEEEEDTEEGGNENPDRKNDKPLYRNPRYKPHSYKDLLDLSFWMHVRPFIQKHGRVVTHKEAKEEEEEGEGENEEEEENEQEEKEMTDDIEHVPTLLSPCSEDILPDSTPPWTIKTIHNPNPLDAITLLRSNIWPGAYAFARDKLADMIYVGWGQKYCSRNYLPPQIPQMCDEYPLGPAILEINDPSVEEEKEYQMKKEQDAKLDAEETDHEGEEEGDDEGDED